MKIAICPGSFDPVTKGHLEIIRRTSHMFDKVIVVVMHNYHKTNYYFSAAERVELITRCTKDMPNVIVDMHDGLLATYAKEKGAVAIVKGLRAVSDFDYEFQQALQVLGTELLGSAIEEGFKQAQWAQAAVEALPDWEIVSPAQLAMLNFRFAPDDLSEAQKDTLNETLSVRLNESGYAAMFTTVLRGKTVLRICAIHPETTKEEMETTVRMLDEFAREEHEKLRQRCAH